MDIVQHEYTILYGTKHRNEPLEASQIRQRIGLMLSVCLCVGQNEKCRLSKCLQSLNASELITYWIIFSTLYYSGFSWWLSSLVCLILKHTDQPEIHWNHFAILATLFTRMMGWFVGGWILNNWSLCHNVCSYGHGASTSPRACVFVFCCVCCTWATKTD